MACLLSFLWWLGSNQSETLFQHPNLRKDSLTLALVEITLLKTPGQAKQHHFGPVLVAAQPRLLFTTIVHRLGQVQERWRARTIPP